MIYEGAVLQFWLTTTLEQVFHPLPASVYMDGVGFCFLAQTLHPVEACYRINGLKKLVLAHFSIAQKFISNAME